MALTFKRLGVFVLTKNIFAQLHVSAAKVFEKCFDALLILHHLIREIVYVDIDAYRAHDAELFAINRDGGAFEFSRPDVQLVDIFAFDHMHDVDIKVSLNPFRFGGEINL